MNSKMMLLIVMILNSTLFMGCATNFGLEGRKAISECMQINESGSYILTRNLGVSGDCLGINVHYVTIDLNGFTLYGDGTGAGVTTYDDHWRGVVLRNGNITNFNNGVEMKNVRDAVIENIRSTNNTRYGIRIGSSGKGDAIIKNCVAVDNGVRDIITVGVVAENIVGRMSAARSAVIGNVIKQQLVADHSVVVNNNGDTLDVSNCPTLIMGNNFKWMTSGDPPPIFNADCKVIHNIPAGLNSP